MCYIILYNYSRVLELLEMTCPTVCASLFNVRPGVLSKTLSHMWGKLNLPMLTYLTYGIGVLLNTPGLKLKRLAHTVGHVISNNSNTLL